MAIVVVLAPIAKTQTPPKNCSSRDSKGGQIGAEAYQSAGAPQIGRDDCCGPNARRLCGQISLAVDQGLEEAR